MKTAAWMFSALVACIVARVNADGVCYDPNHGSGMSADSARRDMQTIKNAGFSHVRTYITDFGVDLADIVAKSGLRGMLGIPFGADSNLEVQIQNAIRAAKSGNIDYIAVGNENAANGVGGMVSVIQRIKAAVPGNVKVGTVQRAIDYINPVGGMAEVVQACDFVAANIHPWFHPNTKAENAIQQTDAQWKAVMNSPLPGIAGKLILGETGWPSSGSYAGNVGSVEGTRVYWEAYKKWSSFLPDNKKFYFQMFDTPYKGGDFEGHYGLYTSDSQSKFGASGNPAPAPAPETKAPTPTPTTPAPTTPAPTTPSPTTPVPTTAQVKQSSSSDSSAASDADVGSKKRKTLKGSGSSDVEVDAEAGHSSNEADSESTTESTAQNEAGVADTTGTAGTSADSATAAGGARSTGSNDNSGAKDANTKSANTGSSSVGVVVIAVFGVMAVGAAFAFIYKARQKAAELEDSERKSMDSFAITPGGGCAL